MPKSYTPKKIIPGKADERGNIWYTVTFQTGETASMLAKNAPEVGKPEWGDIEDVPKRGGGTYKKFKRAPKEDAPIRQQVAMGLQKNRSGNDDSITRMSAIKTAAEAIKAGVAYEELQAFAERVLGWIEEKPAYVAPKDGDQPPVELYDSQIPSDEEVDDLDLDSIPF